MVVAQQIIDAVDTRSGHAFIVTSNVHDIVLPEGSSSHCLGFRDMICRGLSANYRIVYCYTLSRGYATYINGRPYDETDSSHKKIGDAIAKASSHGTGQPQELVPRTWSQVPPQTDHSILVFLQLFENLLYSKFSGLPDLTINGSGLIIENADYLVPHQQSATVDFEQRVIDEALLRWGYDRVIRNVGNFVVLLAAERGGLASDLLSPHSGYEILQAPFPDTDTRLKFLQRQTGLDATRHQDLASMSNGLRLADLEKAVNLHGSALKSEHIKLKKREVLEGLCRGTAELIEPKFGLDQSNAQPKVKDYLERVAELIKKDQTLPPKDKCAYIPKGLLFVGPPGNGKSHLTMAFAKDSDMTMVRFKNVRSMWLGETERNLENLLEILPTLKPVVVFVDEIDQMMSARGMAGQATSHEVEQHVLARLLEFMGDDSHRGEILWIGATNRPDLLDAAMLRRFDRVLPFMNPGREQVKGLVKDLGNVLQLELQDTLGSTRTDTWDQVYDLMVERNMSCDAIQKTIRHASELASLVNDGKTIYPKDALGAVYDYIQNHDPTRYLFMCLHSLAAISFVTDIPWDKKDDVPEELGDYFDFGSDKAVVGVNRSAIENKLREIRLYV